MVKLTATLKKKLLLVLTPLVLTGVAVAAWLMWPTEEIPEPIPEVKVKAAFLQHDPAWADSVLATMTLEEKVGQLFIAPTASGFIEHEDSLNVWISRYHLGNVHLKAGHLLDQTLLTQHLKDTAALPLLISSETPTDVISWPDPLTMLAVRDSVMLAQYDSVDADAWQSLSVNLRLNLNLNLPADTAPAWHPLHHDSARYYQRQQALLAQGENHYQLNGLEGFNEYHDFEFDTLNLRDSILERFHSLINRGLPVISLSNNFRFASPEKPLSKNHIRRYFAEYLDFNGLLISPLLSATEDRDEMEETIFGGSDLIVLPDSNVSIYLQRAQEVIRDGALNEEELNERVHKILLAKSWAAQGIDTVLEDNVEFTWTGAIRKAQVRQLHEASITLLNNQNSTVPLREIRNDSLLCVVTYSKTRPKDFIKHLPFYSLYVEKRYRLHDDKPLAKLNSSSLRKYDPIIINLVNAQIDSARDREFLVSLKAVAEKNELVIVNQGNPENLAFLPDSVSVIQTYSNHADAADLALQTFFGGIKVRGKLPLSISDQLAYESGEEWEKPARLSYGMPEEVGMSLDSLNKIQWIAKTVISRRATPGCQVLVARKGKVIYHQSFGHHTYEQRQAVKWTDLYDLASVTKVASTTMGAMQAYEDGKYKLYDSLYRYLPDTLPQSTLRNITWFEILTHRTGLSSGQKILKFLDYRNDTVGRFDQFYCDYSDEYYSVQIADSFYLDTAYADTIWHDLNKMWIDQGKPYKYSDANFNLLYFMLSSFLEPTDSFDGWMNRTLYQPLGLQTTCYRPLRRFPKSRIVPTENEKFWRKQLLRGHVHDPTAALLGGVAGNAGLFSNANDMAILFQMILNGGEYGGRRYFSPETVKLFTDKASNGHRGLGFNKTTASGGIYAPDAPLSTYGHTGFTGICVWVDPDAELVYLFLSNRVHPNAQNKKLIQNGTRKRIHQAIYDSFILPTPIPTDTSTVAPPII